MRPAGRPLDFAGVTGPGEAPRPRLASARSRARSRSARSAGRGRSGRRRRPGTGLADDTTGAHGPASTADPQGAPPRMPRPGGCRGAGEGTSNPQTLRRQDLNLLRLPIPPHPLRVAGSSKAAPRRREANRRPWPRAGTSLERARPGAIGAGGPGDAVSARAKAPLCGPLPHRAATRRDRLAKPRDSPAPEASPGHRPTATVARPSPGRRIPDLERDGATTREPHPGGRRHPAREDRAITGRTPSPAAPGPSHRPLRPFSPRTARGSPRALARKVSILLPRPEPLATSDLPLRRSEPAPSARLPHRVPAAPPGQPARMPMRGALPRPQAPTRPPPPAFASRSQHRPFSRKPRRLRRSRPDTPTRRSTRRHARRREMDP